MTREFTVLTDVALITCIVQRGTADAIIAAAQVAGAQGATVHYGRGSGVRERLGLPVRVLESPPSNIKLTTDFDLTIAEAVLATRQQG